MLFPWWLSLAAVFSLTVGKLLSLSVVRLDTPYSGQFSPVIS